MEEQVHKAHRSPHGKRNDKEERPKAKGNNPRAFAIQSVNKARRKFAHAIDRYIFVCVYE